VSTGAASASTAPGASLNFGLVHGAFTLRQARQLDIRWYHNHGLRAAIERQCDWKNPRVAICEATLTTPVLVGGPSETLLMFDRITRSGPCSITGRITSHRNGITVVKGSKRYGNCFTGPLVVLPEDTALLYLGVQAEQADSYSHESA
jgi:hypothetical protein